MMNLLGSRAKEREVRVLEHLAENSLETRDQIQSSCFRKSPTDYHEAIQDLRVLEYIDFLENMGKNSRYYLTCKGKEVLQEVKENNDNATS